MSPRLLLFALLPVCSLAATESRTLPNPLAQSWPHELVSLDFPPSALHQYGVVNGMGEARPVQWETTMRDGQPVARAWFIATIEGEQQTDPKTGRVERKRPPQEARITFTEGKAPAGIQLQEQADAWVVRNGVYEFRVNKAPTLKAPVPLSSLPHWYGGSRVQGTEAWDGKARFDGSSLVEEVRTEVVQAGPVFVDIRVHYRFAENQAQGETRALPMLASKRTHFDRAGVQERETLPAASHAYDVLLRFVAGDPWAEVVERYRLPPDPSVENFRQHQYHLLWGTTAGVKIDTVMWMRWFEYDTFGGNDQQQILPAQPRPMQKGRPFALLRPRWNQGGGGAQDFFVTAGGKEPVGAAKEREMLERELKRRGKQAEELENKARELDAATAPNQKLSDEERQNLLREKGRLRAEARELSAPLEAAFAELDAIARDHAQDERAASTRNHALAKTLDIELPGKPNYSPDNPAYGIVAAYPSKWVGPYHATIAAYATPEQSGVRLGLTHGGGGGGNDGASSDHWFGQRAYAICTGPRSLFDNTGKVDNLVRRHSDWTLTALANKYILEWERRPDARGPHILTSRKRLEKLRADYQAGRQTPEMELIRAWEDERAPLEAERAALRATANKPKELAQKIKDLQQQERNEKDPTAKQALREQLTKLGEEQKLAEKAAKDAASALKRLEGKLGGPDAHLVALIRNEKVSPPKGPSPDRYFKRYQDDSVNPTNYGNRRMVNDPFLESDLLTVDRPYGDGQVAAIGYIYTDLDAWPGWQNGWSPGNPNFHTDKYIAAIFAGASMPDHPHADEWMEFGKRNMLEDLEKVLLAPDGVGYECPGYAGFSFGLQLKIARVFENAGFGNPLAENALVPGTARWHRKLITPYDFRLQRRHEAPIGDTHRWDSGFGANFLTLAPFYAERNPALASELMGTFALLKDSGAALKAGDSLVEQLTTVDLSIPATPATEMDWRSEAFFGFGAILRTGFQTPQETFLSLKAGRTTGHYHNDGLSYHYYADGTPISLDYNCSYHPRGDHAALHNSMTFGNTGTVQNNARNVPVEAMEQLFDPGRVGTMVEGRFADLVVAERDADSLTLSPVDPHDAEFSRGYPSRKVDPIAHRRSLLLIKHPADSALSDYLVVLDETRSREPQQLNVHLLARDLQQDGNTLKLWGQYEKDMLLHLANVTAPRVESRWWHYYDEWMNGPGDEYTYRPGESQQEWSRRMDVLKKEKGWAQIPGPGWKPQWRKGDARKVEDPVNDAWQKRIHETDGKALLPPPGWSAEWKYGEIQLWLRIHSAPGTPVLWVLYPYERGGPTPSFETLDQGHAVRVSLGAESETIRFQEGRITVERNGTLEVLNDALPALGTLPDQPLARK